MLVENKVKHGHLYKKEVSYVQDPIKDKKAIKQQAKDELVVNVNSVPFDGDTASINYMSSVVALANAKFNQALASGATVEEAYELIYKTTIKWKNANNTISNVQVETIAKALEDTMSEVATVIGAK